MQQIKHYPPPEGLTVPPLSYAAQYGSLLFVSGIPGHDAEGNLPEGFEAQFRLVVKNLRTIFERAGGELSDIIKASVLLTRPSDIPEMNRLYAEAFGPAPYPARITSIVTALPSPEMLIEIDCIARVRT